MVDVRATAAIVLSGFVLTACTATTPPTPDAAVRSRPSSPSPVAAFDAARVAEVVRVLAGEVGPRETTSDGYRRAGAYVADRFRVLGYRVTNQRFRVPAGLSNLVAVPDGDTFNVVAEPRGFDRSRPHVVVGAHLDTVPQAPGAVDNATGVGVVIELARLAALMPPAAPVVFVAFGGEEARVPKGGLHGSKAFVAGLTSIQRAAVTAAIVIDRAGTGRRVPVCTASDASRALAREVLARARRAGVPAFACTNSSSDHVSFMRAGVKALRIGPDDFPEYHTPRDVPSILVPAQVQRIGHLLWETLRATV